MNIEDSKLLSRGHGRHIQNKIKDSIGILKALV